MSILCFVGRSLCWPSCYVVSISQISYFTLATWLLCIWMLARKLIAYAPVIKVSLVCLSLFVFKDSPLTLIRVRFVWMILSASNAVFALFSIEYPIFHFCLKWRQTRFRPCRSKIPQNFQIFLRLFKNPSPWSWSFFSFRCFHKRVFVITSNNLLMNNVLLKVFINHNILFRMLSLLQRIINLLFYGFESQSVTCNFLLIWFLFSFFLVRYWSNTISFSKVSV